VSGLSPEERVLLRLSAAVTAGDWNALRELRRGRRPDRGWREVLLQAHLFCGFPRVVEAWGVLREGGDLGSLDEDEREDWTTTGLPDRGRRLFDAIYAESADAVRATLAGHHPELARWIEEHAYARVLTRAGLTPRLRELAAVVALAVQAQDRQLASHTRGAVRLGATPAEVLEALEAVADLLEPALLERAREVVSAFANASGAG
jgi:AhpD family alkylhydroperoxidase